MGVAELVVEPTLGVTLLLVRVSVLVRHTTLSVVPGNVIVVESVPASVKELLAVRVFPAARVSVPVPVVIVLPLTVVGVIAPRVSVMAGVVVAVATEPETPFAVTTLTEVTVPLPEGVAQVPSPLQ